jgi:amino acid adenylation domain-containing protein
MSGDNASTKVDRSTLLRTHYAFQSGCFVSKAEERPGGILAFADFTPVPMWNHSAFISGTEEEFEGFLTAAKRWHNERNRPSVIYLGDPTERQRLALERANYEKFDQEAWMIADAGSAASSARVLEVQGPEQMEDFINVFSNAFSAREAGYRTALVNAASPQRHFLLKVGEDAVAGGTLVANGKLGCLYNIATVSSQRQKGFGTEIVSHLIALSAANGCETIFLQVESNSAAQRLYERLGFTTAFVRHGYRERNWQPSQRTRTLLSGLFPYEADTDEQVAVGRESRPIPAALIADLQKILPGIPAKDFLAGAWAYLLHRYTGQEAVSLRLIDGSERSDISVQIGPERNIREWLSEFKQAGADAEAPETSLCFSSETSGRNTLTPSLPLELHFEGLHRLQVVFRTDLFKKDTIRRITAHYLTLLESISRDPNSLLRDLEILPDAEKHQLLVAWNEPNHTPVAATVIRLFEEQVERSPEAIALAVASPQEEQFTYRQLNRRANRLAHRLQEMGVGPEVPVAILLDRSPEMIIALLAVLKAGGVCVPLDLSSPAERIAFVLQDLDARAVLTKKGCVRAPIRGGSILFLDDRLESLPIKDKNPGGTVTPENAAYIIYTSGSTGTPKGVVVSHGAFANHCVDCRVQYGLSSKDRVLQFSAFHFDAAFEQTFPPLISGATLVLRDDEVWTAAQFGEKLREFQLSVVDLPTPYWHELAEYWAAHVKDTPPHCLRLAIVGGEALSQEKLKKWQQTAFGEVRLINAYGPTETTITAASYEIPRGGSIGSVNVPIGRARGDRKTYVLDPLARPVPIGIPGELHIGGTMLARGYHKQRKLTESRFLQNPFSDDPNARLYKTGDLVRYLEDGTLEFLGRLDDQVKVRGYRIELGEIEANLRQHPAVRECIVLARPTSSGEKRLVAYATTRRTAAVADLRSHLQKKLPDYMLPSHITLLEKWPLLANGKINRQALPDAEDRASNSSSFAGPRDALELQVQLLFERVLKRAPIGIDQSFFELGGDSLQALGLLIHIEKETGKQLPLGTLYQASTVEAIARELRSRVAPEAWSSLVPLQARGNRPPFYLLHTTPGDILGYGNLVYRLGPDQPCFGFQSLGLKNAHLSHTSIEEMARYYVDLLRRFQLRGPYYLGGWCYGGVLAVEMARVLQAQGEEVGLLALLETVAMPARFPNIRYYAHRSRCFLRMSPQRWLVYVREKARYARNSRLANRMRFRQVEEPATARDPRLLQLEHVYNTNLSALNRYRSSYYPGTVTLFNAADKDPAVLPDQHYGWIGLAKEIEIYEVPGNHDTMLTEPNVSILAEQLNRRLREAQQKKASP